MKELNLQH